MEPNALPQLRELISRHAADGEATAIDRVLVSSATGPTEPAASSTGTVMALIAQGTKRLSIGRRTYEYEAGQYLVASVDLPVTGHYSGASEEKPALGFGLVLEPSAISALLLEVADRGDAGQPIRPSPTPPALGVAKAPPELIDAVTRMLRLIDRPEDQKVLGPMIEREILWRLLNGPLGETVRQIGLADSSLSHISEAVRWISTHYSETFRVEDLARSCGMSTSAFHRSFQAATALSPIQFQKQIRLQKSRLMLISGSEDVGSIGFKVGYESASQFSREYRRQFGQPPGRDAARLRGSPS
jgi:AraC-like DNA-binding protein